MPPQESAAPDSASAAAVPELQRLCQMLRSARQDQGLSVETLAQRLHMGPGQLAALETGELQRLPEPVFVIAQARRVADALGIDIGVQIEALRASEGFMAARPSLKPDVIQAAAQQRKAAVEAQPKPKPKSKSTSNGNAPRLRLFPVLAWLLLASGLGAGGAGLWLQRQQLQGLVAGLSAQFSARKISLPLPTAMPTAAPAAAPAPKPLQPASTASQPKVQELVLSARQPTWLEVRPAAPGAAPLFRGRFIGERRFPLGTGLRLRAGRPDLLMVSQDDAPAKPLGTISEIRWVSFKPQS